jgi:hypothetical protein
MTPATPTLATPPAETRPAPPQPASNVVFFEPLGNGLLYSLDYERFLSPAPFGLRAGASFFTWQVSSSQGAGNLTLATFPFVASFYYGPAPHKLQLGLGATILYFGASTDSTGAKYEGSATGLGFAATGVVGYRYLPPDGGFTFGVGFTPLYRTQKGFLPWGGASAGWAF